MTRKVARYVLPEDIDPERLCATVPVPNDPDHIAAFMGAVYGLSKAYEWANDDAHTAIDVAAVWLDCYEGIAIGECQGCINWHMMESSTVCEPYDSTVNSLSHVPMCDGCEHHDNVNFITAAVGGTLEFARFAGSFVSNEVFNPPVGGHICTLYARTIPNSAGNVWTFVYKDCLGDEHEEGGTGTVFQKFDFECQWFCISADNLFSAVVTMDGPYICGVA